MKISLVFEWHRRFRKGRENVKDDEDDAHQFLRYQGSCLLWIHSTRPISQPSL